MQYSYDQINRLTGIAYTDGSTVNYAYDKDSHKLQMIDSSSTTTYTYDPRSRLLSETRTINGQLYTLDYQYDAASRLVQLTYPDGYVLHYNYDQLNRITSAGNLATLTYRKNNQLATVSYGNGVQTTYSYDKLGRVTRIHTWNSTATMLDLNYAYDPNGNPTSVNSGLETYGYDGLNRLTNATGPFGTLSYTYDQVGNRLNAVVNGTGTNYSYGPYNKLQSAGSTTYDNNGNMITKTSGSNSWTYSYDYENRLKQVTLNGVGVLQAEYDGDGRRIQTVAGDTTLYQYLSGSWDPSYVNNLTSEVVSDIVFAGIRVGKVQGGVNYYYHLDRLGSVRLVTQSANIQSFSGKYLPYGATYGTSGSEPFQYTGKQLDISTSLMYYGYRYYDSQSGRFMSVDPAQPDYQNPHSINQYIYALDNPLVHVDPTGALTDYQKQHLLAEQSTERLSAAEQNPGAGSGKSPVDPIKDPTKNPTGDKYRLKHLLAGQSTERVSGIEQNPPPSNFIKDANLYGVTAAENSNSPSQTPPGPSRIGSDLLLIIKGVGEWLVGTGGILEACPGSPEAHVLDPGGCYAKVQVSI